MAGSDGWITVPDAGGVAYDTDMSLPGSTAEARFRAAQDSLPAHARVARAASMFCWARGVIRRDILSRRPDLSDDQLKWETALRLYGADPTSRKLIQRMLDHVSG